MNTSTLNPGLGVPRDPGWVSQVGSATLLMWACAGTVSAVGLIFAAFDALGGLRFPDQAHRLLLLFLWATVFPVPGLAWSALQAQRKVWCGRVTPRAALHQARQTWIRTLVLSSACAVTSLWGVVLLAPPSEGVVGSLLFIAGHLVGMMTLLTLASAAWRGLLPGVWVLPGALGLIFLVAMPAEEWSRWVSAEGWRAAVLTGLLAMPLVAAKLLRAAVHDDPRHREPRMAPGQDPSLHARWTRFRREWLDRFQALDLSARGVMAGVWSQLPQQVINGKEEGLLFMPWQSSMTFTGVYRLLVYVLIALVMLRSPSLHWRSLLAPGAHRRDRLGWQVAWSTWLSMVIAIAMLLAFSGLWLLVAEGAGWARWAEVPQLFIRYMPLWMIDMALATALATCLRGWAGSLGRALGLYVAFLAAVGLVHLTVYLKTGVGVPEIGSRGPVYVAITITLTVMALWAARHAWARTDLGELRRRQREQERRDGALS